MSLRPRKTWSLLGTALLLALLVVLGRLTWEARAGLARGRALETEGATLEAIAHHLDAARAFYPGNPYAALAFDRLETLAFPSPDAPANADVERRALEALRTAVLATRSIYLPHAAAFRKANERLATLYARWESVGQADTPESLARRESFHRDKLNALPGPRPLPALVALAGLFLWVGGAWAFMTRGLTPALNLNRGPALGAVLAFVMGLALFLLGLAW